MLEEQIKRVAEARKYQTESKQAYDKVYQQFVNENIQVINAVTTAKENIEQVEKELREMTIETYNETGNKAPATGVGIREVTKYDYDPALALKWAKSHDMALKLDDTAFKKIIKADAPEFVKVTTEPQATIATDLTEYLK